MSFVSHLRLESATRSLKIQAPQKIALESMGGNITASCLSHLKLESSQVTLDSKTVILKGLKTSKDHGSTSSKGHTSRQHQSSNRNSGGGEQLVYQLCVCANGKLFLAEPEGECQADKHVC